MRVTKTAAALLFVGLIVGIIVGFVVGCMLFQPQFSALHSNLDVLDAQLEEALVYLNAYAQLLSDLEEVCVQLEKDIVFLEDLNKTLIMRGETEALEEQLALWSDARESSGEVDATLPSKVDAVMDALRLLSLWSGSLPSENATWEEIVAYELEGLILMASYDNAYYAFETAYISAIQRHIRDVTEFTEG